MAEKWTVSPFLDEPGELDQTYKITATDGTQLGFIYDIDDAHLISAAPLMLEALERMIKYIEAGAGATAEVEYGAVLNPARAAIAAAKGE